MYATKKASSSATNCREKAAAWFKGSGIQAPHGGVSRYYRGDTQLRLPDSTEITGYAVAGLMMLGLEAEATSAADFLLNTAWNPDLEVFPFELAGSPQEAYFFDSGIIARGLLRLYEQTGQPRLREGAEQAAASMSKHFRASDGFHPILKIPSMEPLEYTAWWSRRPGCFHLKAALAWCEVAGTADPEYQRQLAFSLATVDELIAIETQPSRVMDRLHPYCYFLEGLLPVAQDHAEEFRRGIAIIASHLRELESSFCRSDVYAQLLRLRLLADSMGLLGLDEDAAACEAAALQGFLLESSDVRLDGAFAFGRRDGELIPHANPVSTIFAVQALDWWSQFQAGRFHSTWRQLI